MNRSSSESSATTRGVNVEGERMRAIRDSLHELANVFTGMMIATGLLAQNLNDESLRSYVVDIGESGERGSALVRKVRSHLLAACDEAEQVSPARQP